MIAFAWMAFGIALAGFGLVAAMIIFHLNRYAVPGDRTPFVRRIFLVGCAFFTALSAIAFLSSPFSGL